MISGSQTIQALNDVVGEMGNLAQKELALFRAEINHNLRLIFEGLVTIIIAAVFAMAAIILFTKALVDWLATIVHSDALSSLIVGAAMALLAIGLGLYGRHSILRFSILPNKTLHSIKMSADVLSERSVS